MAILQIKSLDDGSVVILEKRGIETRSLLQFTTRQAAYKFFHLGKEALLALDDTLEDQLLFGGLNNGNE